MSYVESAPQGRCTDDGGCSLEPCGWIGTCQIDLQRTMDYLRYERRMREPQIVELGQTGREVLGEPPKQDIWSTDFRSEAQ